MIELLKTSTDPQISKGVDALKQLFLRKKDTVPLKDKAEHLKKINLLQFVKTARNFQLWITELMFFAKILKKYLTVKCNGAISSVSVVVAHVLRSEV